MTEWKASTVRHIPEAELHAYLDQALSRSQCVEIERHLARCFRCQTERDGIAALRDRTTALLARIGPPPIVPPAFETLKARATLRAERRGRWLIRGAWAASLLGALAFGWEMNHRRHLTPGPDVAAAAPAGPVAPVAVAPTAPAMHPAQTRSATVGTSSKASQPRLAAATPRPAPRQLVRASHPAEDAPEVRFVRATETDPTTFFSAPAPDAVPIDAAPRDVPDLIAQPVGSDPGLQGLWRTIVPTGDGPDHGGDIPLVPGLPVVQMRVQPGSGVSDVTAVDQLLESGDLIRTIAGPVERVATLVDEDERAADSSAARHPDQGPDRMTVTIRQGDRMVAVTGPSQALGSLLARVNVKNAKRRY